MKNNKTIIVDCNYVGHAVRHTVDTKLQTSSGVHTNVIYGFLQSILMLSQVYSTNKFVFVWDSKLSKRKELFPEYKKSRHKDMTPEEKEELRQAFLQFQILRKRVIPTIGFQNNFMEPGYEGDDMIASVIQNDDFGRDFLLYASDHDLYQLLSPRVAMIKRKELYTIDKFVQEFGINPSQWWMVKTLAGCSSDEVPGIRGVGEMTACKWLRKELKEKSVAFQKIVDNREEVERRNIPLVKLPFEGTPVKKITEDRFDIRATRKMFQYYEFDSFLEEFDEWREMMR